MCPASLVARMWARRSTLGLEPLAFPGTPHAGPEGPENGARAGIRGQERCCAWPKRVLTEQAPAPCVPAAHAAGEERGSEWEVKRWRCMQEAGSQGIQSRGSGLDQRRVCRARAMEKYGTFLILRQK